MRILDFVLAVEQAEHDLYLRLAECSHNNTIRSVFRLVAMFEKRLLYQLRELKNNPQLDALQALKPVSLRQDIKENQAATCELLETQELNDNLSSFSYVLQTEQLVYNLYANLMRNESDSRTRSLLDLIMQEKQHEIAQIHSFYDVAKSAH